MGRNLAFLIIALGVFSIFLFFTASTDAANLSQALIRLDRLNSNTATGGLMCAQPTSNLVEGQIAITFPPGFTVNSLASNWTVNTSSLPQDASPWPGINTANQVSGQTVIFPSSDLSLGNLYCFNFSGTNTLTTGSTGDKSGTIATRLSSGTQIDSLIYGVTIQNNDQVSVSATVPANSTDFEVQNSLISPSGNTFAQNTTLTYEITYGSNLNYPTNITVEAEWSLGTIDGSGAPTVDLLDYVIGSAGNGYNNTPPVIDTINRKITWTIAAFPANQIGETVIFQLKTNSNYTGASLVSFDVDARVIGPGTQTIDSTVTKYYQYNFDITPTPTPTSGPISTPKPGGSSGSSSGGGNNPTPTPIPPSKASARFTFDSINIEAVNSNSAKIGATTSRPSSLLINYGTNPNALTNTINSSSNRLYHSIEISDLLQSTQYYFRIQATSDRNSIASDIFTFTTSSSFENTPIIDLKTLILVSNNKILFAPGSDLLTLEELDNTATPSASIILPTQFSFEFRIGIHGHQNIKRILGFVKDSSVLGINNFSDVTPPENNIELFEISPGIYSGRLLTKSRSGNYELYVRIYDNFGNITEQKISTLRIVEPLTILNPKGVGIENAKVTFYSYNSRTRLYDFIPPDAYPISNPSYTESDGTIRIALPKGKYRIDVEILGFVTKSHDFEIGNKDENYPAITLEYSPFNILELVSYYKDATLDIFTLSQELSSRLSISIRFFNLIAALSLALLTLTTLFAFSVRTHIPLQHIPTFLLFHTERLIMGHSQQKYIHGEVMDQFTGKPVSRATISIYDAMSGKLLSQATTDQAGEFMILKKQAEKYNVVVKKDGYNAETIKNYGQDSMVGKLQFFIENQESTTQISVFGLFMRGLENLAGVAFETLLIFCLIFEAIFVSTIGVLPTLPFLIITVITFILWLFYASRILRKLISPAH